MTDDHDPNVLMVAIPVHHLQMVMRTMNRLRPEFERMVKPSVSAEVWESFVASMDLLTDAADPKNFPPLESVPCLDDMDEIEPDNGLN